jgi:hypothetical protein
MISEAAAMRIVARIEKIAGEQYLLDGRVFDSFLSARREMTQRMRARRAERLYLYKEVKSRKC